MKIHSRSGVSLGLALLLSVVAAEAQAQGATATRIAYVNSQRILAEAPGAAEAQRTFEGEMARYGEEVDNLERDLERLRAEFERQSATLSATVRQQRQQDLQQRFTAFQQRVEELEATAQRRRAELVQPVMRRVTEAIEEVRREGNFTMILDLAAGSIMAADPALDLTDRVLTRLRRTAAAPGR
jgi:outer membrane protein